MISTLMNGNTSKIIYDCCDLGVAHEWYPFQITSMNEVAMSLGFGLAVSWVPSECMTSGDKLKEWNYDSQPLPSQYCMWPPQYCIWASSSEMYNQSHKDYWLWDLDQGASQTQFNCWGEGYGEYSSTCANTNPRRIYSEKTQLTKNDMNLIMLKGFPYSSKLINDNVTEADTVTYTCHYENCEKEFNRSWNLLDHARKHLKVKPFACRYCSRCFTQKGNMQKHEKTHKIPEITNRKRYKCSHCGRKYTERYNYRVR